MDIHTGAMIFGDPHEEHIQFSEGTLWSGEPDSSSEYNFGIKENVHQNLSEVRKLLNDGKVKEADLLVKANFTDGRMVFQSAYKRAFGIIL